MDVEKIVAVVKVVEGPMRQRTAHLEDGSQVLVDMLPEMEIKSSALTPPEKEVARSAIKMRRFEDQAMKPNVGADKKEKLGFLADERAARIMAAVGASGLAALRNLPRQ
jgi:hypothetical protein